MAPGAQIILVEANSQSLSDLMAGVVTAANQPGVSVVSMSWGFAEGQAVFAQDEALYDGDFTTPAGHQGVTFVASTGDYGTADPEYPAFSPNVLAVGGTSLKLNADDSYENETGWGYFSSSVGTLIGSGGGTSLYEAEPAYQLGVQSTGSRSTPDVSFFADPATGAWISDPYNLSADNSFEVVGGTSLSAPCWAGLIGLANQGRAAAGQPTLNSTTPTDAQQALYSLPQSDFNAITSGSNGGYSAGAGYNMVTGLGTPQANLVVPGLVAYQQASDSYQWVAPTATGEAAPVSVINVFNALTVTGEAPTMSRTSGPASPSGAVGGANALPPISQVWTSLANDALDTKVASTSDIAHLSGFGNVSPNRAAFVLDQLFAASLSPATVTSRASLESRLVAPVGSDQLFGRLGEGLDGQNAMPGFTRDGAAAANDSALQAAMEEWSAGILSDALNLLATSNSPGYHGSAGDVNGSGQQSPGEQALLDLDGILAAQVNDHDIDL
jgi:hypothetical protein